MFRYSIKKGYPVFEHLSGPRVFGVEKILQIIEDKGEFQLTDHLMKNEPQERNRSFTGERLVIEKFLIPL